MSQHRGNSAVVIVQRRYSIHGNVQSYVCYDGIVFGALVKCVQARIKNLVWIGPKAIFTRRGTAHRCGVRRRQPRRRSGEADSAAVRRVDRRAAPTTALRGSARRAVGNSPKNRKEFQFCLVHGLKATWFFAKNWYLKIYNYASVHKFLTDTESLL